MCVISSSSDADLGTCQQRESVPPPPHPFNGYRAGSTPHDSLFGIQPWIDLRHVKTSECSPYLNSFPSSSFSLSVMSSLYFLFFFCLPLCLFLSLCFQCLFKLIAWSVQLALQDKLGDWFARGFQSKAIVFLAVWLFSLLACCIE